MTMNTIFDHQEPLPDLTDSASSQSSSQSSSRASTVSSIESSLSSMHFEDINIDDDTSLRSSRLDLANKENWPDKDISAKRPVLATLQTRQKTYRTSETGSKSAVAIDVRRHFSSPTTHASIRNLTSRTRSESPVLHKPRSAHRLEQFAQTPATSLAVPSRRSSWQPQRKTIYEIEAEYHDSDDELPDDASLFNVPVSPSVRAKRSVVGSATSSVRGSPDRGSPPLSPGPLPLDASSRQRNGSYRSNSGQTQPRQRLAHRASTNQLRQVKSSGNSPQNNSRSGRTKSWNVLVDDLDSEARLVAEKLEFYYENNTIISPKENHSQRNSAPGAIPLPPIQRGTLDFMPMSKEKEAVLSRTRPSWLPPKDPREERRHLEEYQRMMKASREAEQRREEKLKNQQSAGESTRDSLHRIWTFYIEPSTDLTAIDKRIYDLCWKGLPSALRGRIWQRRLDHLTNSQEGQLPFHLCRQKVQEIKSRPAHEQVDMDMTMIGWFADIERDAETAFTDLHLFQRDGPQRTDLVDLCEAYAVHQPEVGYAYGMQLVAALILLQVSDPAEAFALMLKCLSRDIPNAFQAQDQAAISRTFDKIQSTLDIKFPRLHNYLFGSEDESGLGFHGQELFDPMCRTLFANGLNPDVLCRVWDIWIFEGDRYLIRTAVALLGSLQTRIFDIQGDVDLRRRNIQEMLGWGPCNRDASGYWKLEGESFIDEIRAAGKLDCAAV